MSDRIETYLDELADRLQADGARVRRVLAETEDHLRETAAALRASGSADDAANAVAIARFGSPDMVARTMRPSYAALARDTFRAAWLLGGLALVAVGASGLLAWVLRAVAGSRFLAGDPVGVTYTADRCADFLEYFPRAGSCASAAAMHHSDEVVFTRVAAGALGLLVLGAYGAYRRRATSRSVTLPRLAVPMVATVLFAAAGAALSLYAVGMWLGAATQGEAAAGIGDPLSAGLVALLAATAAAISTVRRLVARS